jgi:hypothetical protein
MTVDRRRAVVGIFFLIFSVKGNLSLQRGMDATMI